METHDGLRDYRFKDFIKNFVTFNDNDSSNLVKSKLYTEIINFLISDENIPVYDVALTTKAYNFDKNYELFEILGDSSIDKFLIQYARKKFPQIDNSESVDILSKIKNKYRSKKELSKLSKYFEFQNFINYTLAQWANFSTTILEDCFESMIGATEYLIEKFFRDKKFIGIGYIFIYRLLEQIFEKYQNITIKYEDLVDAKVRINELKDHIHKNKIGELTENYYENKDAKEYSYIYIFNGIEISRVVSRSKKDAKEHSARQALEILENKFHIVKQVPERYRL